MCLGRFVVGPPAPRSQMWRVGPGIDFLGFDPAGLYFIGKVWIWVVEGSVQGPDLADDSLGTALHTPRVATGKV